jgi:hypothetical protein
MGKDSMVFYTSWLIAVKNLPREIQGEVLTAILEYGLLGETTESLKPIAATILELVKPQIEINQKRYENSLKGGRKPNKLSEVQPNENQSKTKVKPNENQSETYNVYDNVYVNDNVNVNVNVSDKGDCKRESESPKAQSRFIAPTVEQVQAYCKERGNSVDAQRWIDHYTSNGWMVGKNKMKDWKAAVRTWEKNGVDSKSQSKPSNLGVGEWMDGDRRTYGSGATTIPIDAPARPSERYGWSKAQGKWIIT